MAITLTNLVQNSLFILLKALARVSDEGKLHTAASEGCTLLQNKFIFKFLKSFKLKTLPISASLSPRQPHPLSPPSSGPHFAHDGGFKIREDSARDVFFGAGLAEKGVEGVVFSTTVLLLGIYT